MASDLDLAAQLPGEADFLAAVVASPADDTTRRFNDLIAVDGQTPGRGRFARLIGRRSAAERA